MKMRFVKGLVCVMLASAFLGGCGNNKELDTTSVYIRKDGSVASAVYEEFDTNTYSEDELQTFVEDAVNAYNQKNVGTAAAYMDDTDEELAVAITSLDVEKGDAVLKMEYASCGDYMQFNEGEGSFVQLASGTVAGAAEAGIDMNQFELIEVDGSETIKGSYVDDKYYVVFAEGNSTIVVDGTIVYATSNVTVDSKDTAQVSSIGELSCIIFK